MIKNIPTIALVLVTLVGSITSTAQDAKAQAILTDLSAKMAKFESVSASFKAVMVDRVADLTVEQSGTVKVSGDKFKATFEDNIVISDGDNLWTYSGKTNEVMIDYAEDAFDEQGVHPADLFTIWETGFKSAHGGVHEVNGVTCDLIKLFPNDPSEKSYHTIRVYIDKDKMEMKRAVVMGREGSETTYDITSFNTDFIKSDVFTFNKASYPGVEEIDNR